MSKCMGQSIDLGICPSALHSLVFPVKSTTYCNFFTTAVAINTSRWHNTTAIKPTVNYC